MELAARLPGRCKRRGRTSKYLLRKAFADLIPPENLRLPKRGFGVPVGAWLRGPLRPWLQDLLLSPSAQARGLFRPDAIRRRVEDHLAGRADHGQTLWSLAMLETWYRTFVDAAAREAAAVSC